MKKKEKEERGKKEEEKGREKEKKGKKKKRRRRTLFERRARCTARADARSLKNFWAFFWLAVFELKTIRVFDVLIISRN